jgi:hypothetical protein
MRFAEPQPRTHVLRTRHDEPSADGLCYPVKRRSISLFAASFFFLTLSPQAAAPAAELKDVTKRAFERYTQVTDDRNTAELQNATGFLWVDSLPEDERGPAYAALQRGEVEMRKVQTRDHGAVIACPGGLIHHWVGLIFIPGAKLEGVLAMLEDYDHHSLYFAPDVERSKLLAHDDDHFRAFLRFRRHKVITVVLNTEHDIHYFRDTPSRAHSRSSAVRIAQVENNGRSNEREEPPGNDGGFLWGMETWWRMEERDGGVYVQSEVASLTRNIPTGLGWMIGPFVNSIPKETLTQTLEATRRAVESRAAHH